MSFHLAAAPAKAIKVLPVLAAAMAFSLLPPAPSAEAQVRNTAITPYPVTATAQFTAPDLKEGYPRAYGFVAVNQDNQGMAYFGKIRIENVGNSQSVATQVSVRFQGHLQRLSVPSLGPGQDTRISLIVYREFDNDSTRLWIRVDPDNLVVEANEWNNFVLVDLLECFNGGLGHAC